MNAEMISNLVDVELIHGDGVKYSLKVSRTQPTVYALVMNNSLLEVEVHRSGLTGKTRHTGIPNPPSPPRMSDGSLLLSLDGSSYTTYMKEEVDKYRVVIGGRTCVFEKENDPRVLR